MLGQDLAKTFSDKRTFIWDKDDMDITDPEQVQEKLEYIRPKLVINAAAFNAVDAIEEEEKAYAIAQKVNVEGVRNVARVCAGIESTFVHYSSDYVFDGTNKEGYAEDATPHPMSKYAQTKYAGEQAAQEFGGRVYIVRTCKLFGIAGESEVSKKSFVDTMLELAKTKTELSVVDEEYASPTYTPDLAQTTRLLIDDTNGYMPGIYHVTNSGACTWYAFAQEIFKQAGIEMKLTPVTADTFPRPAPRPKYSQLLNTKLPELRSWQEALKEYLNERKA